MTAETQFPYDVRPANVDGILRYMESALTGGVTARGLEFGFLMNRE